MNSERSTSSNTLHLSIWYEIYLRLKQRCRKFWTVVNSGIEEAYTGRPYVSFGKTIDLKCNLHLVVGIPLYENILSHKDTCWSPAAFNLNMFIKSVSTL